MQFVTFFFYQVLFTLHLLLIAFDVNNHHTYFRSSLAWLYSVDQCIPKCNMAERSKCWADVPTTRVARRKKKHQWSHCATYELHNSHCYKPKSRWWYIRSRISWKARRRACILMPDFGMFISKAAIKHPSNNEPIPPYSYAKPGKLQPSPCCLIGYMDKS